MAYPSGVKALIIAPAWVGDMVMAQPLLQLLVTREPNLDIHVAAPSATAALSTRMLEVNEVHTFELGHGELNVRKRLAFGRRLREHKFDVAYVLPNSWKSALVPLIAGIERRVGWHGEARYMLLNDRRRLNAQVYPLMVERLMALASPEGNLPAKPYPSPILQPNPENLARCLEAFSLSAENVTVLCPGAEFGAAKKWPAEHYADVARAILAAGQQVWLMGSPKDVDDCAKIAQLAPGAQNLAGHTTLLDALDLLSVVDRVVCNDSGLMHVACAVGRPTIGIFGSTSPQFTPPLGEAAVVVEQTLDCRPCFQRTCPLGHLDCLRTLSPHTILQHLDL